MSFTVGLSIEASGYVTDEHGNVIPPDTNTEAEEAPE